jgi:signal transduction histidine kinase
MAMIPSQLLKPETAVVSLSTVQRALWQLGMPILNVVAVGEYKKGAKRAMLWRAIRWHLVGMAALVVIMCIGRQWNRVAVVAAAAVALATLFGWLVSVSELLWQTVGYSTYRSLHAIPPHVSAMADALLSCGVSEQHIGVEYLKDDPILYVEDAEHGGSVQRYDLIIW